MSNTALNNNVVICSTRIKPESSSCSCFASGSSSLVRLPHRRLIPLRIQSVHSFSSEPSDSSTFTSSSEPSDSSTFISTVGSPPQIPTSNLSQRHLLALNVLACSVAISATWLFCSAIPTLLAFKKAAESMEKLLDVTREELPGTMAVVRLSGMEISDLTMELSDLGQQITQGVRGSTRAVRLAEERLRQFTNTAPSASMQEVNTLERQTPRLMVAETARSMKKTVVNSRATWKMFFNLTRFSKMALRYFASRGRL